MARNVRAPKLENRSGRLKLPVEKKPVFVRIGDGLSLGYRRNTTAGTWVLRVADGKGGSATRAIGAADDYEDADGARVLTFWQAQARARELARPADPVNDAPAVVAPLTVQAAVNDYLAWMEAKNPRAAADTRQRLAKHFLPVFGPVLIADLTKTKLERWLGTMVKKGDPEEARRSKDSANRVLSMVKAALNRAASDPANGIRDDSAWRLTKPFREVGAAREVHYSTEDARRLIAAAPTPAFADLLTAGFLTGARYGELVACEVRHFDPDTGTLTIPSGKTGRRVVILHTEAIEFFVRVAAGRPKSAPLLPRPDGARWGTSHQARPMKAAIEAAGLDLRGTYYALRHSYISRAIEAGVPLTIVAENCGTSVRMIETTYAKTLAEKRREFLERGAPRLGGGTVIRLDKARKGA